MNGVDTLLSTKEEMVKLVVNEVLHLYLLRRCSYALRQDILNLELLYDPHGFAFYDKGEVRVISLPMYTLTSYRSCVASAYMPFLYKMKMR